MGLAHAWQQRVRSVRPELRACRYPQCQPASTAGGTASGVSCTGVRAFEQQQSPHAACCGHWAAARVPDTKALDSKQWRLCLDARLKSSCALHTTRCSAVQAKSPSPTVYMVFSGPHAHTLCGLVLRQARLLPSSKRRFGLTVCKALRRECRCSRTQTWHASQDHRIHSSCCAATALPTPCYALSLAARMAVNASTSLAPFATPAHARPAQCYAPYPRLHQNVTTHVQSWGSRRRSSKRSCATYLHSLKRHRALPSRGKYSRHVMQPDCRSTFMQH